MTMEGLPFTYDISNNNNGGNWLGALIGGVVGGAVGAGYNNRGNGGNGCCGHVHGDQLIMDQLVATNATLGGIGRDLAVGQSRTESAVYSTSLQSQISQKDNTIAQLAAAHSAEIQGMRNNYEAVMSQKDCCCETNRNIDSVKVAIEREGCQIREAISRAADGLSRQMEQRDYAAVLRQLDAANAENAALKATQTNTAIARETYDATRHELRDMTRLLLAAINNRSTDTSTTTPAA